MNKKNRGFTLVEILISILLISISFILIQRTFFTLQRNILTAQQKMKNSEILFKFFTFLNSEITGICDLKNIKLNKEEIVFTTNLQDFLHPVEVTYKVEHQQYDLLLRKQKDIFTNYEFTIPVLSAENIGFLFFINGEWKYKVETDEKPDGIGLEIYIRGERIFYPVYLIFERKNE
ncbi:MAG: prepilin-type N-terminal cleavage/methylation domain-containing protein [Candidatus Omnitrophica bacterium]|nr:prepilin-type N-terminal cleavage/methylation domain-containing protein [Candidatus Omnitrophota bacterium]